MKEILELRVYSDYSSLLFNPEECEDLGLVHKVFISSDDPRYERIGQVQQYVLEKYGSFFFSFWNIERRYTTEELSAAEYFRIIPYIQNNISAEECGTEYDDDSVCPICGAGSRQIGLLKLNSKGLLKKDLFETMGGEFIVSRRFTELCGKYDIEGGLFRPLYKNNKSDGYRQLFPSSFAEVSSRTIFGLNPFDYRGEIDSHVYKCPNGDTLGKNVLSEVYLKQIPAEGRDLFFSRQYKSGRMGVYRHDRILFCSKKVYEMVKAEKLTGFKFEVVYIDN